MFLSKKKKKKEKKIKDKTTSAYKPQQFQKTLSGMKVMRKMRLWVVKMRISISILYLLHPFSARPSWYTTRPDVGVYSPDGAPAWWASGSDVVRQGSTAPWERDAHLERSSVLPPPVPLLHRAYTAPVWGVGGGGATPLSYPGCMGLTIK